MDSNARSRYQMFLGLFVVCLIIIATLIIGGAVMLASNSTPSYFLPYVKGTSELVDVVKVEPGENGVVVTTAGDMTFEVSEQQTESLLVDGKVRVYSALGLNWITQDAPIVSVVSDDYEPLEGMTEITDVEDLRKCVQQSNADLDIIVFISCLGFWALPTAVAYQKMQECVDPERYKVKV